MKFQSQRGTSDVLPQDSHRWARMEGLFREVASLYGFSEIRTPTFEDTQLFTRTAGETSDIVTKQMYTFLDKGDRSITLKPEGTAPAMRASIQHGLLVPGMVTKLFYITPFFRYERPQLGRFREAHQFGLELIGSSSPFADAEVIEATVRFFERVGLTGLTVLLNSIGNESCRFNYREAILKSVASFLESQPIEIQEKAKKNPLRLLDSKDPETIEAMRNAPSILDFLEPESLARFDKLQSILDRNGIKVEIHPEIVRGLDYYNETVFEVQSSNLGAQGSLCGGGRYDGLIRELGGPDIPAIGVGIGEERALLVEEALGLATPHQPVDVFVAIAGDHSDEMVGLILSQLRADGFRSVRDFESKGLKSQLKNAANIGAKFVILIGDDEIAGNYLTVKLMDTGNQVQLNLADLISFIKENTVAQ